MTLDFHAARENMVENQVRTNDVTDHPVQDAMRLVARERLCPPGKAHLAYAEALVEYAPGLFLMQPRDISKLLQAVRPRAGQKALAICAPYAAAVLAQIGLSVTLRLPEGTPPLDAFAATSVAIETGDILAASPGAPFDVILCEGAVSATPQTWRDMLGAGGRLGVVQRHGPVGKARLYTRGPDGVVAGREIFDATPPLLAEFERAPAFVF